MDFLTVEDVSLQLGLSEKTVRNYINSGELKAYKLGTSWKIKESDLMNFIESRSNTKTNKSEEI